jgi:hypothetical protein
MAQFVTPLTDSGTAAGTVGTVATATQTGTAPFASFLAGLVIVTIPLWVMDSQGSTKYQWTYTSLILLTLVIAYSKSITKFMSSLKNLAGG